MIVCLVPLIFFEKNGPVKHSSEHVVFLIHIVLVTKAVGMTSHKAWYATGLALYSLPMLP